MREESNERKKTLLVALGGNALIRKGQRGTIAEQFENLRAPLRQVALLSRSYRIILTHGNGPQVGNLLLQQESCASTERLPLEILVAQTQGQIGYMIESTLDSELMKLGRDGQPLVSLLSYVLVDERDPAFSNPTKPIGPAFPMEKAGSLAYPTIKTPQGFRRIVASPEPMTIIEKLEIGKLINMGFIVITCGGGGIPVVREGRSFAGVNAVIDKDLASERLAREVGVDIFLIATDVDGAAVSFGTPDQKVLRRLSIEKAHEYMAKGEFPPGSMGPKIEACIRFIRWGGGRAVITSISRIEEAIAGTAGTEIVRF